VSKSAKKWAIRRRRELIIELGGVCKHCGEDEYEKLTFDHIHGKDWEATGLSTDQRMCRYVREHRQGLLQILCLLCNSKKGRPIHADIDERICIDQPDDWVPEVASSSERPF
jgi:hypothetical protein